MAGSPSASGPLNSETLETSSHLEISHESKDSEISQNSSEVYGLERKPMPPASKFTHRGFRKAAVDSAWYVALKNVDCGALMSLLKGDPSLLAQTGQGGCTVLHAAAKGGCLQLLDEVYDLFKNIKDGDRQFLDEVSGVEISLDALVNARYGDLKVRARDLARFTCPDRVCRALKFWRKRKGRFSPTQRSGSDPSQHLKDKLVEIMETEPAKKAFKATKKKDCIRVPERKELSFHYMWESKYYIAKPMEPEDPRVVHTKTIIDACDMLAPPDSVDVLTYLFQLHNARGQTLFHLAVRNMFLEVLLELLPKKDDYKDCLNAKDVRGWTVLHYVVALGDSRVSDLKLLLNDERVDVNATTPLKWNWRSRELAGMTALHLAILHQNLQCLELLLNCPRTNVNALFYRRIYCGYERERPSETEESLERRSFWSPLQLAAIAGSSDAVRALLQFRLDDIYDVGKFKNNKYTVENFKNFKNYRKVSALLLAAGSGHPDTLRVFLDHPKFNPLIKFEEATGLHYAAYAKIPTAYVGVSTFLVGPILAMTDFEGINVFSSRRFKEEDWDAVKTPTLYSARQACSSMLLQAGVNIWDKDHQLRYAAPGPQAPAQGHIWWQERIEYETSEARKSLRDGGYAISVIAALVASASYGGPLQPPLGFGTDPLGVQDTHLTIRVFMVSNSLSFLFAIASVLFAIVPSLPMPQEAIYVEWQRTRRTVGVAVFFILMSVISVLISFGAAWSSVVSEHYSVDHIGLLFYPILVGD